MIYYTWHLLLFHMLAYFSIYITTSTLSSSVPHSKDCLKKHFSIHILKEASVIGGEIRINRITSFEMLFFSKRAFST